MKLYGICPIKKAESYKPTMQPEHLLDHYTFLKKRKIFETELYLISACNLFLFCTHYSIGDNNSLTFLKQAELLRKGIVREKNKDTNLKYDNGI